MVSQESEIKQERLEFREKSEEELGGNGSKRQTIQNSNFSFNYEEEELGKEQEEVFRKLVEDPNLKISLNKDIEEQVNNEESSVPEDLPEFTQ